MTALALILIVLGFIHFAASTRAFYKLIFGRGRPTSKLRNCCILWDTCISQSHYFPACRPGIRKWRSLYGLGFCTSVRLSSPCC